MMGDRDDRLRRRFRADSHDLTPASARRAAETLYLPIVRDAEFSILCASVLSEDELERASRYAVAEDRNGFQQRRAFRRYCGAIATGSKQPLSDIAFEVTPKGRPHLAGAPDLWFSFSSCRLGVLAAWSSTHTVGVDVEDPSRELEAADLARQFFSAAEAEFVAGVGGADRLRAFYRFWSLKEAALKSIGEGLPFGLDTFEFELDPTPRMVGAPSDFGGPERYEAAVLGGTGGCAAFVARSRAEARSSNQL